MMRVGLHKKRYSEDSRIYESRRERSAKSAGSAFRIYDDVLPVFLVLPIAGRNVGYPPAAKLDQPASQPVSQSISQIRQIRKTQA
jgi:hypothetical protein